MMPFRRSRWGYMFPVTLVALMIFAIVGVTMMFTGTSEYQQTAVVVHGAVANQLALGLMEEMQAIVYDRVNDIDPAKAVWRPEVIAAAKTIGSGTGVLEKDLKEEVPESKAAIEALKGELVLAKVGFRAFHAMKYATENTYDKDAVYYRSPQLDVPPPTAPGNPTNPRDFFGSYRLEVAVRFGKALKYYTVCHDLKVIDLSPPAREFCLFAFNVFKQEQEDYLKRCLNEGGPMHFFANDRGRIFMRGPYFLDTSDDPEGIGGKEPERRMGTNPTDVSFFATNKWFNHTALPAPHEGLMGGSFNNRDPGRPEETSKFDVSLNTMGFDFFNGDPGMNMPGGQQWFVGTKGWGTSNFSVFGAPEKGYEFAQIPRCLKNTYNDQGQKTGSAAFPGGISGLSGGNEAEVVQIEGEGLVGKYHVASFSVPFEGKVPPVIGVKMKKYKVEVDRSKPIYVPYGIRWEKEREGASGWVGLIIDIASLVTIWAGGVGGTALQIALTIGKTALQAFAAQSLASMLFPPTSLPPTGVSAEDLLRISENGYWPSNFKPYTRAATRKYETITQALGGEDRPLLLDGTIMVDKMSYDKTLVYKGKGILSCFANGVDSVGADLSMGVKRENEGDHLTVVFMTQSDPTSEEAMLKLGNSGAADPNYATFMAAGGIKPIGPNTTIMGTLVCLALNKDKIDGGSSLDVYYDKQKLAAPDLEGTYDATQWMMTSVSPKISCWSDRFVMTSGGGIGGEDAADLGGVTGGGF